MAKNLETFITELKKAAPEEIVEVKKTVDPEFEATALLRKLELEDRRPMVIFRSPQNLKKESSLFPLTFNTFATRKKLAVALGLDPADYKMGLTAAIRDRYKTPISPLIVTDGEAPVKEVRRVAGAVDLFDLPIPTHHAKDGGPFILGATVVMKDPLTGNYNAGLIRLHVKGKDTTLNHAEPRHHTGMILKAYHDKGEPCPFAAVIGHHPAFYLGSQWTGPYGRNEYEIIGAALDEPLRLVPSETLGKDFLVPADAEIILEGYILPGEKGEEGPVGEHTRYYKTIRGGVIEKTLESRTKITAMTHRRGAYYQSIFIGHAEHGLIGSIPIEAAMFEKIRSSVPGIKAVHLTPAGCCRYICHVSLRQRVEGEAKDAILQAFTGDYHIKYVIAVDEDIDVFNDAEVLWAVATRTQPQRNTFIIPDAMGSHLDPTVGPERLAPLTSRMGIDATKPIVRPFPEVCEVPLDLLEKIRIEDYISS
jgi:2,5-furandicarboxylate decarboxylase 1